MILKIFIAISGVFTAACYFLNEEKFKWKKKAVGITVVLTAFLSVISVTLDEQNAAIVEGRDINTNETVKSTNAKVDTTKIVAITTHKTVLDVQCELNESIDTLENLLLLNRRLIKSLRNIESQTSSFIKERIELIQVSKDNNQLMREQNEMQKNEAIANSADVKFFTNGIFIDTIPNVKDSCILRLIHENEGNSIAYDITYRVLFMVADSMNNIVFSTYKDYDRGINTKIGAGKSSVISFGLSKEFQNSNNLENLNAILINTEYFDPSTQLIKSDAFFYRKRIGDTDFFNSVITPKNIRDLQRFCSMKGYEIDLPDLN